MKVYIMPIHGVVPTNTFAGPTPTGVHRRFVWCGYRVGGAFIPMVFWHQARFPYCILTIPDPWWTKRRVRPRRRRVTA